MLGTCLLYVGAVLINGYCGIAVVDGKSGAVMKIFAGLIGVIIQSLNLSWGNVFPVCMILMFLLMRLVFNGMQRKRVTH